MTKPWVEAYPPVYEHHGDQNRLKRLTRRDRDRARRARTAATEDEAAMGALMRSRLASRRALVEMRLSEGFRWHGGAIGGRTEYRREPLVYKGLVSDEAPILQLFVSKTHRARKLLTGNHKGEAEGTDSKLLALDSAYVETVKAMRGVLRVELDRDWPSWADLEAAIVAKGVPLPNVAVGYADPSGRVWRPHLLWILADSVSFTASSNRRNQAAWRAALAALTAALLPIGADPCGAANPHRHKNPVSPLWDRRVMAQEPYSLDVDRRPDAPGYAALRPHLPSPQTAIDALKAAQEERQAARRRIDADHPDEAVAAESNGLFNRLNAYARRIVVSHRDQGEGSRDEFAAELALEALALCPGGQRAGETAKRTARTVAAWTWAHYRAPQPKAPALPADQRHDRLAAGAKQAAAVKATSTLAAIVAALHQMTRGGVRPTQQAVADAIGRTVRTVSRYWTAAISEPDISLLLDKKEVPEAALPFILLPALLLPTLVPVPSAESAGGTHGVPVGPSRWRASPFPPWPVPTRRQTADPEQIPW